MLLAIYVNQISYAYMTIPVTCYQYTYLMIYNITKFGDLFSGADINGDVYNDEIVSKLFL